MEKQGGEDMEQKRIFSASEIEQHIRLDSSIEWVPLKDLMADRSESCVDGRGSSGIIGTPGGNAGELVLALSTAESVGLRFINEYDIVHGGLFDRYLKEFGKFYLHTDKDHGLKHLGVTEEVLRNPPEALKAELMSGLLDPANTGCGHMMLMMQNPEDYGVRKVLVKAVIEAFFIKLWSGDNADLELVVLDGGHQEGAVVNVLLENQDMTESTRIPTISPMIGGQQMFVNHPQATSFMRSGCSRAISSIVGFDVDEDKFESKIHKLGQIQLEQTVGHLAKNKPIYNAYFVGEKLDRVELVA